ncbi:SAGA complex subunit Sgf73 [Coemansia sp. RSA 1813]|nr:SAGA complex subunit Sgf73 [Coemansia sp. RSA 1646]KAJ1773028.1 SAGA complex subunit Sgf73 [Coemansia sp. RSA 1843]KAJ2092196.1 SAGA complex subunit Sgf73 [Coemansia sp. RSA 986]KAJ2215332.1 SAGA complex subunit Sgf73 [Coemansia sp. RSA 487]KAJ2570331.1 SAGA complex subunit Sgf73 [Coemansia sp. RSA 1813]
MCVALRSGHENGEGAHYGGNGHRSSGSNTNNNNGNGNSWMSTTSQRYLDILTDDQRRMLKRRIETLKTLEEDIEKLRADRIERAMERLDIDTLGSVSALAAFGSASDWEPISADAVQRFGQPPRLTWEMLKKAVAEEDKYQSKKNWSSTKGRGNRKAPIARRLDVEVLKKFGVYPEVQFPLLATCDSCSKVLNAQYLQEHQEVNCSVPSAKRDDKKAILPKVKEEKLGNKDAKRVKDANGSVGGGVKRQASEALSEDADGAADQGGRKAKMPKMTKKERQRLEKEQKEKERLERREQLRLEKERKKKEKDEKKERELAKAKLPLDLDKQCGVLADEPGAQPCTRSLTCKTHSMAMKRGVRGRSKLFDALLQAHLAKSRSAAAAKNAASKNAAAKSSNAVAVRNATAIVLGGEAGVLDESFFEDSDQDHDSDSEAELVIDGIKCSHGKPLAVRPSLLPRRRHHYLRVRDLFYDALKPPAGSETSDALAT